MFSPLKTETIQAFLDEARFLDTKPREAHNMTYWQCGTVSCAVGDMAIRGTCGLTLYDDENMGEIYTDPSGKEWVDYETYLQEHVLGFCPCGTPAHSITLVRDVLRHIKNLKERVWTNQQTFAEWEEEGKKICGERELYFLYYFLDSKEFTEHGGSVPGWLTPEGEEALRQLERWVPDVD